MQVVSVGAVCPARPPRKKKAVITLRDASASNEVGGHDGFAFLVRGLIEML